LLLVSTLLQAQPQSADGPEPDFTSEQLVNRMSEATKNLNYAGVFVFTRGTEMDVMRMLHKSDARGEREKIVSLTGPAREIIRNNQTVTCIFPDTQQVMVERSRAQSFPAKLADPVETLAEFYQFTTTGSERIADRDTWIVSVAPKDNFRYGYQLWIDKNTFLLLKSELRDESGKPLEMVMFTELELPESIGDELFTPSITGDEYTWYQYTDGTDAQNSTSSNNDEGPLQLSWMPAGFKLSNHNDTTSQIEGDFLKHMIYTDGVSMVSIFIEKLETENPSNTGSLKIGGVNVYAKITGDYQVTAVGEVPQTTVMRMVDSIVSGQ